MSPIDLLRSWASGWRTAGLGSPSPGPERRSGCIGTLGVAFIGAMGLLRTVLILGMIPLGALFAYQLPAPTGSRWAQIACLLVYVAVPLPYNALADGRWDALVLYAAAPAARRDAGPRQPGGPVRRRSVATPGRACRTRRGGSGCWRSASSPRSPPASLPVAVVLLVLLALV